MMRHPGFTRPSAPAVVVTEEPWVDEDEDDLDTPETKEPVEVGMTTETKDLYREDYRMPWEEWAPDDIGLHAKSTEASAKFALIVRREKQNGDTEEPVLALHSITVQSPLIKNLLGPVFAGYQGINTNLKKLEFRAPFREFFYRWSEFLQADPGEGEESALARSHYKLLSNVISSEIVPHIEQAEDLLRNNVISFDYVWTLFEPGTEIYSRVEDQDRLYLLNGGQYQTLPDRTQIYNISCRYIDTDGETFGYATTSLGIAQFANVKPVAELNVLPSHLQPKITEIRDRLVERGRKFEALKGLHYKSYDGTYKVKRPPFGAPRNQYVEDGRVIVDCGSFMRHNGEATGQLAPLDGPQTSDHLDAFRSLPGMDDLDDDFGMPIPQPVQMMQQMARQVRRKFAARRENVCTTLSRDHYPLCSPLVKGFCLKAKTWVYLRVDQIKEIVWNENAFEQLVLPHDYKQIIWAFVDAQLSQLDDFDDVVKGKGKGIIMLLSGEPGTGKTLTSESVAEAMKKPLYSMSAGELGNTAEEVEKDLHRVLELSTKWNAVLLLDECDVFLEQRSISDLHRNKLVSVFLRLLEYYQGVLFLTTNRAANFDPAFESRIHLTINYPRLDFDSRLHVWRTFVSPCSATSKITEQELRELAAVELNGRQIKNIVKTARLLATRDRTPLALSHVEVVLRVKRGESALLVKTRTQGQVKEFQS